jgi:DivIVA domain-containing protein
MWLWVVGIVAVVGAVTVVAVGSGASLSEAYEDRPDRTIPVGRPLRSDDLQQVTFTTALRGYRMDEVDALLARVRADLLAREAHEPAVDADGEALEAREPGGAGGRELAQREAHEPSGADREAAEPQAREPDADDRERARREAPAPGADHGVAELEAHEPGAPDRERARREARGAGGDDREAADPGAG